MKGRQLFFVLLVWIGIGQALSSADQAVSQPASQPTVLGPTVKVDTSIVDVGVCWCGSTTTGVFQLQNLGALPLEIVNLRSENKCELAPRAPRRIAPKQSAEIPVLAIVPTTPGRFERTALIELNDRRTRGVIVKIRGEARPAIEVDPPMAGFGKIREAQPAQMTITLTNHSEEPVKIEYERIAETEFTFELVEKEPGRVYQLKVALKPPFDPGKREATINLTTDLANQPNIPIRAVAYLSPRVEVVPNMVKLGPPDPDHETKRSVTFMNNDAAPIRLVEATSDDPSMVFGIEDILPGKAYRVVITLPKNYDPGTTARTITLHTDDTRQSDYGVVLIGPSVPTAPTESRGLTIMIEDLVGKPAPMFNLTTMEGKVINNAAAATQVLALNFFTSHNYANTQAVLNIEILRKTYAPRGVRFVNVAEEGPSSGVGFAPEQMAASLKKAGANSEMAADLGNIVADAFHLALYPTLVVVDKSGRIDFALVGTPDDFMPRAKAHFEALLGPAPALIKQTTSAPTPEEIQTRPALGMTGLSIPQFSIQTMEGKPVGDEEVQNAPATIINIVAADCGFCKRQLPNVESIREEYQKKGVRFINICETLRKRHSSEEVVALMKANNCHSELAYDPDNKIGRLLKSTSFPTMFVVRRDGRIENVNVGVGQATRLRGQLDDILKGDASIKGGS